MLRQGSVGKIKAEKTRVVFRFSVNIVVRFLPAGTVPTPRKTDTTTSHGPAFSALTVQKETRKINKNVVSLSHTEQQ